MTGIYLYCHQINPNATCHGIEHGNTTVDDSATNHFSPEELAGKFLSNSNFFNPSFNPSTPCPYSKPQPSQNSTTQQI